MGRPVAIAPREIALVKMSALGDVVHALPVANALKRAYPGARLTWIVQPVPYQLLRHHPAVDEFIVFHRRSGVGGAGSFLEAWRNLRHRRFDLVVDLQVAFKASLVTALLRAPKKLGFDRRRAPELNWLFTTHRIPARPLRHVQDEYLEFLEDLGIATDPVEWKLALTEEDRAQQRAFFQGIETREAAEPRGMRRGEPRPVCAVVVGTSRPYKDWPSDRYARLLEVLESELGLRCVLVGGPSAGERRAADEVMSLTCARPVDALADDVRRLLWLLAGSALVIAPDTGPLHIAHALEVPAVGLYGYTNPKRWGPYRRYRDLIVDGYARFPGESYPCSNETRRDGMSRITVEAVLEKARRAMQLYVRSNPGQSTIGIARDARSVP